MTTSEQINSTEFKRLKEIMKNPEFWETHDALDGPEQECFPIEDNTNTDTRHLPDGRSTGELAHK